MIKFLQVLWHGFRCPQAGPSAIVRHSRLGRIYSCGCGFEVWEVWE